MLTFIKKYGTSKMWSAEFGIVCAVAILILSFSLQQLHGIVHTCRHNVSISKVISGTPNAHYKDGNIVVDDDHRIILPLPLDDADPEAQYCVHQMSCIKHVMMRDVAFLYYKKSGEGYVKSDEPGLCDYFAYRAEKDMHGHSKP